jgi:hypothetical protein
MFFCIVNTYKTGRCTCPEVSLYQVKVIFSGNSPRRFPEKIILSDAGYSQVFLVAVLWAFISAAAFAGAPLPLTLTCSSHFE